MEITIQEQMRRDSIIGLDLNLKQFMEIVEPVNFTTGLSRWKEDKKWLEEGGIKKMLNKLKEIMIAVEYLTDVKITKWKQKKIEELMFKAFKEGQETPDATEGIIKLCIRQLLDENT